MLTRLIKLPVPIYRVGQKLDHFCELITFSSDELEMCLVEVWMGMGFPVGMGFPWDSRGNGNEKHISMGMGMISVGVGMSKNIWFRNAHLLSDLSYYSCYLNFWSAPEIKVFGCFRDTHCISYYS